MLWKMHEKFNSIRQSGATKRIQDGQSESQKRPPMIAAKAYKRERGVAIVC